MTRIRYTMPARSQGELHMRRRVAELVEEDVHRWVFVYGMDSDVEGLVRVRTRPMEATLELCDRLSNPLIEVDAVVHEDCPDAVCDLGYGIAPGTVIDGGPYPYPTTACCGPVNRRRTRCGLRWRTTRGSRRSRKRGVACTPASHMQDRRKE